jgi:hypothetical protein
MILKLLLGRISFKNIVVEQSIGSDIVQDFVGLQKRKEGS